LAALAAVDGAWIVAGVLVTTAVVVMISAFADCAAATASFLYALCEDRVGSGQLVGESDASATRRRARDEGETQPASAPAVGILKVAE
jgi:hypothetical protein